MADQTINLRSYRLAFELERRIHRIDTFRIPLPYGLPLVALGWAGAALVTIVVLTGVPVLGGLLGLAPWPLRLVFLPGLAAHLLCRTTDDGRPLHEALAARAGYASRPKRRLGLQAVRRSSAVLGTVPCIPDELGAHYRAGTSAGPALLVLRCPARLELRGNTVRLTPTTDEPLRDPQPVRLREGQRLVVA